MSIQTISGIILSSTPIFETDKRIELFSANLGRVTVIAKGAARSTKRFGGRLEPTNLIQAQVIQKKAMWPMTDASVIEAFPQIRTEFNRISMAFYFLKLVKKMTVDLQPHPALFDVVIHELRALNLQEDPGLCRRRFEQSVLRVEGLLDSTGRSTDFATILFDYTGSWVDPPDAL